MISEFLDLPEDLNTAGRLQTLASVCLEGRIQASKSYS